MEGGLSVSPGVGEISTDTIWNSIRKVFFLFSHFKIYLRQYVLTIVILYFGLQSDTIIIYFVAPVVPGLDTGNSFRLVPVTL